MKMFTSISSVVLHFQKGAKIAIQRSGSSPLTIMLGTLVITLAMVTLLDSFSTNDLALDQPTKLLFGQIFGVLTLVLLNVRTKRTAFLRLNPAPKMAFVAVVILWMAAQFLIAGEQATALPFFAMIFPPLDSIRSLLQRLLNQLDPDSKIDSGKRLQDYGHALTTVPLDTDLIAKMLLRQIDEAPTPEQAILFLRDTTRCAFVPHAHKRHGQVIDTHFEINNDLADWLYETNHIWQRNSSPSMTDALSVETRSQLENLKVSLCVPLPGAKQLLGWLALGSKKSGQPYDDNDLVFLSTLANQTAIALENAQLLEQANRRTAELEALQKISAKIQAEAEPDLLLTSLVEQVTSLLKAEGGLVYLLKPDRKTLNIVVSHNLGRDYHEYTLNIKEDIAGQVIAQDQSIAIADYTGYPHRSSLFNDAHFGAAMAVPLRWSGKVRGVLQLIHDPAGPTFDEHDVWLTEFLATEAAIALEKSRLLHEAKVRADQLATLSEVSMAISSTLDLDTTLQRIMDRAVEILHAEAGSLLLVDPNGKELSFEVVLGPTGADLLHQKTAIGKGIVGTVAQTGRPLIVNDVAADPRFDIGFDEATDFQTKDIICVPMVAHEGQVVGVIELVNKQDGTVFNDEDSSLLVSFAAQAAIAIENARIFTRTDKALAERIQELQALQMFDQQLQASLNLERVLDMTLTHAMDALGVSMGVIGVIKGGEEVGLYLLAQRGMPTEMGRYKIDPWPLTKGTLGQVAQSGDVAWVKNVAEAKHYIPKNHRTRSLIVIPIMLEDEVIGVIDLESTDYDYFTNDDVAFVKRLINHAAIAIQNAQLFEKVREANDAKSEFMSIASHELKIPMTSIKGYAKLLQMGAGGDLSDKQNEFLGVIANNVDRMDRLVRDLLDVSRIEAGRIRLEIADVQVNDVIDDVVRSVETQIKNKHLHLDVEIDRDLPILRADYDRLVQIVTNLVSNAYKYTPEGGQVSVNARPYLNGEVQGIAVTVKDTGYGISEEDQAKLFTNFFRASDENIRNEPGTGLGLSITKKMIESHGGELTFESKLGHGSAFTFTLPRVSKIPPGVEVVEK